MPIAYVYGHDVYRILLVNQNCSLNMSHKKDADQEGQADTHRAARTGNPELLLRSYNRLDKDSRRAMNEIISFRFSPKDSHGNTGNGMKTVSVGEGPF